MGKRKNLKPAFNHKQSLITPFRAANLLLIVVFSLVFCLFFVDVSSAPGAWEWIKAFAEAALIGALADWFAITALFRQPLGLPFPHSAIIPSNKDRIAQALGIFVQENFLSEVVLSNKVRSLKVGERLNEWLKLPESQHKAALKIVPVISGLISTIADEEMRRLIGSASQGMLRELRAAPFAAQALEVLLGQPDHNKIFDHILSSIEKVLNRHQEFLREALRAEMPWYVPNFIHDKVYRDVLLRLRSTLQKANQDPQHILRQDLTEYVLRLAAELKVPGELQDQVETLWQELLNSSLTSTYIENVCMELKSRLEDILSKDSQLLEKVVQRLLQLVSNGLSDSKGLVLTLNVFIEKMARGIAHHYSAELAELVSETVKSWDSETMTAKIETYVGSDLQYIRINGTLVGGILGILIHAVGVLIRN